MESLSIEGLSCGGCIIRMVGTQKTFARQGGHRLNRTKFGFWREG